MQPEKILSLIKARIAVLLIEGISRILADAPSMGAAQSKLRK
jgi:hypothetical protein